jgi:crossover junction endodeoxyribonuclease RuvC
LIYIGIDPGLSGAIAFLMGNEAYVFDTPVMNVGSDGKVKRKYDIPAMAMLVKQYMDDAPYNNLVVLESVHSMPSQGVASSFTFGEGLGIWKGIVGTLELPLELPSPQRWKKEMLADQGKDKSASRYKAIQLFPQLAAQLSRVKDDGRAEALLMADYGRRIRKG